eukprot:jgi/Bigna1/140747/aug1.58_g15455
MDLKFINWRLSRAAPEQSRVQVEGALGSTMISSSPPLTPNNDDTVIPKVLRAYIHGVGQKADCMGSYTVYIINIYCDGDSYQVERRYSEFHALNVKLRVAALNGCLDVWTNDTEVKNSKLIHEFLQIPLKGISTRKSSATSSRSELPNPLAKTPLLSAPQIVDRKDSRESQIVVRKVERQDCSEKKVPSSLNKSSRSRIWVFKCGMVSTQLALHIAILLTSHKSLIHKPYLEISFSFLFASISQPNVEYGRKDRRPLRVGSSAMSL